MKPVFTKPFIRDYHGLSPQIQKRFDKQLAFLLEAPRHPSLEARIIDKRKRIWKAKVGGGYRFTFQIEGEVIMLRRIGSHDIMERLGRR